MYGLSDFKSNVRGDLYGGVTAGIVALPLALAFGISSGAGAISGLYGAIFVGFFAAVFGGTRTQISGPTGPMTVVMTAIMTDFMARYPDTGIQLAFTTVVLAGLLQILMGVLKLGKYIIMVPYPVISGFMSGIGVIIILLQLGPLLGFSTEGTVMGSIVALPDQVLNPNTSALALAALTLGLVFFWKGRLNRLMPAPLVALVVGTVAIVLFAPDSDIERIGVIPSGFPALMMPTFELDVIKDVLISAIMLAVLGAIDSLLTSLVADNMTQTHHDSNRELIGQGIGNTFAGFFGGLPGAGATMRTVVNIRAGGTGPLSGTVHSLVLLAIATSIGFLFEDIPLVVLAGILVKVGIDIIDWPFLRRLHRLPVFPVVLTMIVLSLTVFVDLITAVLVGVFIKNVVTLDKLADLQLKDLVISDGVTETKGLSDLEKNWLQSNTNGLVLRIDGPMSYAVGRGISQRFSRFPHFETLMIDLSNAAIVGISTALLLENIIQSSQGRGVKVVLVGAHGKALAELRKLNLIEMVGKDNCFISLEECSSLDPLYPIKK